MNITYYYRVMKLITLLLFGAFLQISAHTYSQTVTLKGKNLSLLQVFDAIREQTGYRVLGNIDLLSNSPSLQLQAEKVPLSLLLETVFKGQPLSYRLVDRNILLERPAETPFIRAILQVKGRVVDSIGHALAGASIAVLSPSGLRTTQQTQSDHNGNFTLENVPVDALLEISFVGYITQRVKAAAEIVSVVLQADPSELEEVLVQLPYGTVKKTAFVGSETSIGSDILANQRVTSFTRTLDGLVPGLMATNGGGDPGTDAQIQIRGVGSYSASSSPLYVVDGVPYAGSLVSLSTDDIAAITVLKDASATALYGSRGANGVIMVTTKTGSAGGKPTLNANVRMGFQNRAIPEYDRVSQQQYYELAWEATRNRIVGGDLSLLTDAINEQASKELIPGLIYNSTNVADDQVVLANGKFNPNASLLWNDDWQKELYQTPFRQDYQINAAGGSQTGSYYLSLGYLNEPGLAKFSGYKRYTGRVNVTTKPSTWLTAGLGIDGALGDDKNVPSGGTYTTNPFYFSRQIGPIYPIWQRDENGNILKDPNTGDKVLDWGVPGQYGARPYGSNANLLGSLALDDRNTQDGNVNANTFIEAKIIKNLTFKTSLGGNYFNSYQTEYQNSQFGDAASIGGQSVKSSVRRLSFTFNQVLTYDNQLGQQHITALVGHENYQFKQNFVSATKAGFPFPGTSELTSAANITGANSYVQSLRIEGFFSRVNYSFKDRYLFSGSFRRDGNSRFFPGNETSGNAQWGSFWSVGGGWRLSQERFLAGSTWIDELKLKASYGEQGNEGLLKADNTANYYAWQSLYELGWNNASNPGAVIVSLPNETLTWEKNATFNTGIDFSLFKKRFEGSIEWYKRSTKNLLFSVPLALSTGISSISKNAGSMTNTGIDLMLGYHLIRHTSLDWRVDLSFSHFKNKITKLPEENRENGIVDPDNLHKLVEGQDRYRFYLREYAGVDPQNGDALYYKDVIDANGNATGQRVTTNNIYEGSFYFQGSAIPDFSGGLRNTLRYKNWELSFLLNFSKGGYFYDGNYAQLMHSGTYGIHWDTDILKRWQTPGQVTDVPRLQNALTTQSGESTRFLYDASYLNIKNISLNYTLPTSLLTKAKLSNAQLFAHIDNAYLFSGRKGSDPQQSFSGVSDWTYLPVRTFTLGLSIGL
ncbi:TonB-linked outer membrane protein, SusC/RagA family [bacterium A37T11]|nr:TonB-linked outer membrane protein, SusC/RagA family [bacterium A37T11]